MDAGEHVEQRPLARIGEAHAVGCDNRHVKRPGDIDEHAVVGVFVAQQMALNFDIHIAAAEQSDERIDQPADAVLLEPEQLAPGKRDEAARLPVEIGKRQRAFAFRRAHLHARDETAEIAIALGGFDENRYSEVRRVR